MRKQVGPPKYEYYCDVCGAKLVKDKYDTPFDYLEVSYTTQDSEYGGPSFRKKKIDLCDACTSDAHDLVLEMIGETWEGQKVDNHVKKRFKEQLKERVVK